MDRGRVNIIVSYYAYWVLSDKVYLATDVNLKLTVSYMLIYNQLVFDVNVYYKTGCEVSNNTRERKHNYVTLNYSQISFVLGGAMK